MCDTNISITSFGKILQFSCVHFESKSHVELHLCQN